MMTDPWQTLQWLVERGELRLADDDCKAARETLRETRQHDDRLRQIDRAADNKH